MSKKKNKVKAPEAVVESTVDPVVAPAVEKVEKKVATVFKGSNYQRQRKGKAEADAKLNASIQKK